MLAPGSESITSLQTISQLCALWCCRQLWGLVEHGRPVLYTSLGRLLCECISSIVLPFVEAIGTTIQSMVVL
jgi:hypothetical protein